LLVIGGLSLALNRIGVEDIQFDFPFVPKPPQNEHFAIEIDDLFATFEYRRSFMMEGPDDSRVTGDVDPGIAEDRREFRNLE
jgi:hypothetical protein